MCRIARGRTSFKDDAACLAKGYSLPLLQPRVELDLVDDGRLQLAIELAQVARAVIAHAYAARQPDGLCMLQRTPPLAPVAGVKGRVDQVELSRRG